MTQPTLSDDTATTYVVPELDEFEQLLTSIDATTKNNNNKNIVKSSDNNGNSVNETKQEISSQKNTRNEASTITFVSNCRIDIESIQNHMAMLNDQIETKLKSNESDSLFNQLFNDVCPKNICNGKNNNSYLITNWIVKLIQNSFFNGIDTTATNLNINEKYKNQTNNNNNCQSRFFCMSNEMNLQCCKYILDHKMELENAINCIIQKERKNNSDKLKSRKRRKSIEPQTSIKILEDYFAKYNHKCKKSDYFMDDDDIVFDGLIDILRNILIQIQIVHRIFDMIEHMCNDTGRKKYHEFGRGRKIEKQYWIPMTIERYLSLGLLDLSLMVNGITLYHLLIHHKKENLLKILLHRVQCDWSVLKDNSGQV